MFCKNCGKELADNERFCSQCGAAQEETTIKQEPVAEPVAEPVTEPVAEETVVEAPVQEEPQWELAQSAPKSKKKLLSWLIPVVAVVTAAAIAIGIFWEPIKGFFLKNFGKDEDYFAYVAEENTSDIVSDISKAYGTYVKTLSTTSTGVDMSVTLNVGDKAKAMLTDLAAQNGMEGLDLDWFDSVGANMDISVVEKMMQIGAGVKLNGTELLDANAILDLNEGYIYAAILSLSNQYLKGDLDMDMDEMSAMLEQIPVDEIAKVLPSEETVAELLNRYLSIAYDEMNKVEKDNETLEIGDIEQKLTTLEVELDQKTIKNVAVAILNEVKNDKEIKTIIRGVAEFADEDADEVYSEFKDAVSDTLDMAKDLEIEDNETFATITLYVNNSHDIVGCSVEADDEEMVFCAKVCDGKNFAYEMTAPGVEITGEGTEQDGVIDGEFAVKAGDMKICNFSLVGFSTKDNLLNGKIRIVPSSDLLKQAGMESAAVSAISLANFELELGFTSQQNAGSIDINLLSGGDLFVGITISATQTNAEKIEVPTGNNVIDEYYADEWLEGLDVEKLLDNLENAGVPSELVDFLRDAYDQYTSPDYPYYY